MTTRLPCLVLLVVAACQTNPPVGSAAMPIGDLAHSSRHESRIEEASFARATEASPAAPRLADAVSAALLQAAAAVQMAEQRVHCENIANSNAVGYKRRVVVTTTTQNVGAEGASFCVPEVVAAISVFTQGALECTGRSLDLAIDGDGFFSVVRADGSTGYTRDGRLCLDAGGSLVVACGAQSDLVGACVVIPQITVPADTLELAIDPNGTVSGRTAGSPDTQTGFGALNIHRFVNPAGLAMDGCMWRPTQASGQPITGRPGDFGLGLVKQGYLERSNVELATELLALQLLEQRRAALVQTMASYGLQLP